MVLKCVSVSHLICPLFVLQQHVVSLPFSSESDVGLHTAPVIETQEQSNTIKQMMTEIGRSEVFQKSESDIDLRAALCPWYKGDTDVTVMCTSNGTYLSIGHCLTYENGTGIYEFKCPTFNLRGTK